MKALFAFLNGMFEANSKFGTHYTDYDLMRRYDAGRKFINNFRRLAS